jgi:hypothetical protein
MSRWIDHLSDEDLSFVKRFILASGSLKAMADAYGISYPTVRLRLDRLIERVKIYDDEQIGSAFERVLRAQYADGKMDLATLKTLLAAHKRELETTHANPSQMHTAPTSRSGRGGALADRAGDAD